jgi:mRNA-degrading endonuclease RelE of RelBE toxin-antitoxin system
VRVAWSDKAREAFPLYARDREGWAAVLAATRALEQDPYPAYGEHHGEYHRLHVGPYRVHYVITGDAITIVRVDRVRE